MNADPCEVSVIIVTYGREQVLIDTVRHLLTQLGSANELLIIDQTVKHERETESQLNEWNNAGCVRWIRLSPPSITGAMNAGLRLARGTYALYVDDDVVPEVQFVAEHRRAHRSHPDSLVVGRVLQPWHMSGEQQLSGLAGSVAGPVAEFIGCNFSVPVRVARDVGGFDERFVKVAYRYEAEFALRLARAGYHLIFWPRASLQHLRAPSGGTRAYGHHLRSFLPAHSVGEYYFLFGSRPDHWMRSAIVRLLRSPINRHHLRRPWWIPATLISEMTGVFWAIWLVSRGKRLMVGSA